MFRGRIIKGLIKFLTPDKLAFAKHIHNYVVDKMLYPTIIMYIKGGRFDKWTLLSSLMKYSNSGDFISTFDINLYLYNMYDSRKPLKTCDTFYDFGCPRFIKQTRFMFIYFFKYTLNVFFFSRRLGTRFVCRRRMWAHSSTSGWTINKHKRQMFIATSLFYRFRIVFYSDLA